MGSNKQPLLEKEVFLDKEGHVIVELAQEVKGKVTSILYSALKNGHHTLVDMLQKDGHIEFGSHAEVRKSRKMLKKSFTCF